MKVQNVLVSKDNSPRQPVGARRRRPHPVHVLLAVAVGAVLLAACSSSPSATKTDPTPNRAQVGVTGPKVSYPVTNYVGFVGGKSGTRANPNLSTVDIGWINQQGGSEDIAPETTIGAQTAVNYINEYGGGIDGHPAKLVTCFVPDTVSAATTCGQEFANNKAISVVEFGADAIGNQAMESALAPSKKVIVYLIALSEVDDSYTPGFALFGDASHVEGPWATVAKYLKAKSVAIVNEDTPGSQIGVDITEAALKYVHIPVKVVNFDPSDTDLTAPLEAVNAANAGLVIGDVEGTDCSDLYQAVKQLGITTKIAVNAPCVSSQVATADGGSLPNGWYYLTANSLFQNASDPSNAAISKAFTLLGEQAYAADPWDSDAFGQTLTVERWLTEILKAGDKITPAEVAATARLFKGPVPNGAPNLSCGKYAAQGAPAVCNDKVQFLLDKDGAFQTLTGWVGPPAGFVPPSGLL